VVPSAPRHVIPTLATVKGEPAEAPATVQLAGNDAALVVRVWSDTGLAVELPPIAAAPARGDTVAIGWAEPAGWVHAAAVVRAVAGGLVHFGPPDIVERVQRRSAARLRCEWPASVTTFGTGSPRTEIVELVDVSATGAAARWSGQAGPGEHVAVVLYPPASRPLMAVGEVVACDDGRLRVRFVAYGEQVEADLSRLVAQLLTRRARP
jgi:hypothetical protein